MLETPPGVLILADELKRLGWISELFVGGSAATGDYRPTVSDLDLVALTIGPIDRERRATLERIHRSLDRGAAYGMRLGCMYLDVDRLHDIQALHPTWTHGAMVERAWSLVARAEVVRHGYAVFGRSPRTLLPPVDDQDIRRAALAELTGYWAKAAARPWWWLDRSMIDLGLTSMARGRHALHTGQLLTKTAAIEAIDAPPWLVAQIRARRQGKSARSPLLRGAWYAWRDARRTTSRATRS